ncbi:hypothetical protein DACRYDRAFT_93117 [Dacryopinax primogenitus]|uniref:Uncharacterized protein n=1 Tax=Dacryopinax primogenitus (strain DJM 731) TaxID=1858805 RepID=M5G334_DACPD|nr:uncharacterized protein DACRYDRAFT_93117 [Dacryopinax primogenitus]EJU04631.1 hypothetical protein DACRYDRAFT_93117 [Dacryopinax primogenitus]
MWLQIEHIGMVELAAVCTHLSQLEELELTAMWTEDGGDTVSRFILPVALEAFELMTKMVSFTLHTQMFRDLTTREWISIPQQLGQTCRALKVVVFDGKSGAELSEFASVRFDRERYDDRDVNGGWKQETRLLGKLEALTAWPRVPF